MSGPSETGRSGPERAPALLPWSSATIWWLFIDAPRVWFGCFVGVWAVGAVAFAAAGAWDRAVLLVALVVTLLVVRTVRERRLAETERVSAARRSR